MKTLGYYNGKFGPLEEMTVPMNDRACYFGDGVYEATLARNGKIFALKEHLDRFFNSAGLIKIDIPYTKDELAAILYDMLAKMDDKDIFIYWQMTRGTGIRQHQFPAAGTKPNLWIFMKPGKSADSSKRLKLTDMEDTRFLHCNIKTLNLLVNVMAAEKAESLGCGECVFHRGDIVTECAHSNVSIIKDGVFKTHPTDHYILPGITRMHIIQICKDNRRRDTFYHGRADGCRRDHRLQLHKILLPGLRDERHPDRRKGTGVSGFDPEKVYRKI